MKSVLKVREMYEINHTAVFARAIFNSRERWRRMEKSFILAWNSRLFAKRNHLCSALAAVFQPTGSPLMSFLARRNFFLNNIKIRSQLGTSRVEYLLAGWIGKKGERKMKKNRRKPSHLHPFFVFTSLGNRSPALSTIRIPTRTQNVSLSGGVSPQALSLYSLAFVMEYEKVLFDVSYRLGCKTEFLWKSAAKRHQANIQLDTMVFYHLSWYH